MENPTSFDLNRAIQQWRETLAQSPAFRRENLDELEAHLRDSITALRAQDLSLQEAFLVAAKRIGKDHSLEAEFTKVNTSSVWLRRLLWMLIGIQVWGLASILTGSIARNAFAFGWRNINYDWKASGLTLPVTVFALVQIAAIAASVALCWWLIIKKGGRLGAWLERFLQRRFSFAITCAGLCMLTLLVHATSYYLQIRLVLLSGPGIVGETALYSSYSQVVVMPIQVVAMIAFTLFLARKRLRLCKS